MASTLSFFIGGVILLIGIYGLRAADLIEARTSSILYGCLLVAFGLVFLVFCGLMFLHAGVTLRFQRDGPVTFGPDDPAFSHFLGWIFLVAVAGKFIEQGWNLLTKAHDDD